MAIPKEILSSRELLKLTHECMLRMETIREHRNEYPGIQSNQVRLAFNLMTEFAKWVLAEEEAAVKAELVRGKRKK